MRLEEAVAYALVVGVFGLMAFVVVRELTRPSTVVVEPTERGGWTIIERRV